MEVVKSMIHDQDLPMYLWSEVARITVYVHNRISYNALGNKTPKEVFTKENPKLNHLKYLVVWYAYTFPKRKDQSWILQERRDCL